MTLLAFALSISAPVFAQGSDTKSEGSATKAEGSAAKGDMVPLKLKLPKKMFVGTPKNIKSDNLEKLRKGPRPPFMVPKGTVNLALKKTVTGSDDFPIIGELDFVTDGDKEGSDGSFVEFGPGVQHVQIDLEKAGEIYAIVVWHYHANARVYKDIVIQVSDDPDFIKPTTIFNNDHNNSAGLGKGKDREYIEVNDGKLIDAKGAKGRYVRLYSNGNTSNEINHYIEVEVYGKAAS